MVSISFPGLGIDQFSVKQVAFSIGSIEVRWYGILIVTGILLAFFYALWRTGQNGISSDDMYDVMIFTVIAGIVGARTYYVLTTLGEGRYKNFIDVIAIWRGGIAIYGALIAGGLTVFLVCRHKKLDVRTVFDCVAPGVQLAQAIGRWGNFFNGEAYGATPEEGSPLYFLRMGLQHEGWSKEVFYQPCFLYESVWNLLGFILINLLWKKKKFNGQIFLTYAAWYGFGRMFIESTRTDSLYVGVFRISQIVGFACFVIGTALIILGLVRAKRARLAEGDYDSVYGKITKERTRNASVKASESASSGSAGAENESAEHPADDNEGAGICQENETKTDTDAGKPGDGSGAGEEK